MSIYIHKSDRSQVTETDQDAQARVPKAKSKKVGVRGKIVYDYEDRGSEVGPRPRDLVRKRKRAIIRNRKEQNDAS